MRSFRFRAQPALDLRRREHDAAQRALARADVDRQRARDRLHAAERAVGDAQHEADAAGQRSGSAPGLEWYRFWIVRLEQERAGLRTALQACDEAVAAARSSCLAARQRREALERFRDKAYGAHVAAEAAAERKSIDELATQRHTVRRVITEGA